MRIQLDNEALGEAVKIAVQGAIKSSVEGYEVQKAIEDSVASHLRLDKIADAVEAGMNKVDLFELATVVSAEIAQQMKILVQTTIQEGVVRMVCTLRGVRDYDQDYQAKARAVREELFSKS